MVFILLEIGEGDFEDAALESVVGVLETGGAVYERLADTEQMLVYHVHAIASPFAGCVPYSRMLKVDGALTEYQSLRANGSVLFFKPFLPFDNLLFFPTAMITTVGDFGD